MAGVYETIKRWRESEYVRAELKRRMEADTDTVILGRYLIDFDKVRSTVTIAKKGAELVELPYTSFRRLLA